MGKTYHSRSVWGLAGIMAVATVIFHIWLGSLMDLGFDLTDEGFYLLRARNPDEFGPSVTHFGWVLHPLYVAVGGSVEAFRIVGQSFLVGAGAVLSVAVWCFLDRRPDALQAADITIAGSIGATVSANYYFIWLPTPSYNLLALTLISLVMALVFLLKPNGRKASPRTCIGLGALLGVCGVLLFLARPPSAMLGTVLTLGPAGLILRDWRLFVCVLAGGVAGVLFTFGFFFIVAKGPAAFVADVQKAITIHSESSATGYSTSLGAEFERLWHRPTTVVLAALALGLFLCTLMWRSIKTSHAHSILFEWGVRGLVVMIVGGTLWAIPPDLEGLPRWYVPLFTLCFAALTWHVATPLVTATFRASDREPVSTLDIAAVGMVALIPLALVYGTNNPIVWHASRFAGAWPIMGVVAAVALGPCLRTSRLCLLWLVTIGFAGWLVERGIEDPYRLDAGLFADREVLRDGGPLTGLKLTPNRAATIQDFRDLVRRSGFTPGTTLFDATGFRPGLVYAVEGIPPGKAWISPGYAHSLPRLRAAIERTPPDRLRHMWILYATNDKRAFSVKELESVGIDLEVDYVRIDSAPVVHNGVKLVLYRPLPS